MTTKKSIYQYIQSRIYHYGNIIHEDYRKELFYLLLIYEHQKNTAGIKIIKRALRRVYIKLGYTQEQIKEDFIKMGEELSTYQKSLVE